MSRTTRSKPAAAQELAQEAPAGLRYVGGGAALIGVPARDLTERDLAGLELAQIQAILASGLYELPALEEQAGEEEA